jgi:hemerythrin
MANYFTWTVSMSVGENDIDKQHQRLLSQVNKIEEAMSFGATSKEVAEAVDFFDQYTKEHFDYEEAYMQKYKFPYLAEHKKEHQHFIQQNAIFREKLKEGADPRELIFDVDTYIGQWWLKHIGKADKQYHDFIAEI